MRALLFSSITPGSAAVRLHPGLLNYRPPGSKFGGHAPAEFSTYKIVNSKSKIPPFLTRAWRTR